jgi:hypothetical protein
MKEHPILFSGEIVKAILEGRKTMTRRVINVSPFRTLIQNAAGNWRCMDNEGIDPDSPTWKCPYGQVGDRLWVRETFNVQNGVPKYASDSNTNFKLPIGYYSERWHPSIFMPRWASRITLEITEVRVEQLQCIGEFDAAAEGVKAQPDKNTDGWRTLIDDYKELWDSINGKKYPWSSNPWVWVIGFKRLPPAGCVDFLDTTQAGVQHGIDFLPVQNGLM